MRNYVDRHTGRYIHSRLNDAKTSAWICSPYIDKKYLDMLIELASGNIDVRLITTNRQSGYNVREYLKQNQTNLNSFHPLILTGDDYVHAKLYIIDDDCAIEGSVNLTSNGLWNQPNYVHVHESQEEVRIVKDTFNRIWNYNSNPKK